MRVISGPTKTANRMYRKMANRGCNVCPGCGETRSLLDCLSSGDGLCGIDYHTDRREYRVSLFAKVKYSVDCYECNTCGAKWESDGYEVTV